MVNDVRTLRQNRGEVDGGPIEAIRVERVRAARKPHDVVDVISTQLLVCDPRISVVEYGLPIDFGIPDIVRNINLITIEGDSREV